MHPHTVRRWYDQYLKLGFDGLIPKPRNDSNQYRKLDGDVQNQIVYILSEYPKLPATIV